jgi:hypothetical protein
MNPCGLVVLWCSYIMNRQIIGHRNHQEQTSAFAILSAPLIEGDSLQDTIALIYPTLSTPLLKTTILTLQDNEIRFCQKAKQQKGTSFLSLVGGRTLFDVRLF